MINHHWMFGILFVDKPLTKTMVSDVFIVNEPHFVSSDYMWRNTMLEKHSYFSQRTYSFLNHWVPQWYLVYNQTQLDGLHIRIQAFWVDLHISLNGEFDQKTLSSRNILSSLPLNNNYCILFQIPLILAPKDPIDKLFRIGSDNDLAPIRQQTFFKTNYSLVYWRMNAYFWLQKLIGGCVSS